MMSTLRLFAGYTTHPGAMSPDMVWWAAANMSEVELIDINRQGHALTNHSIQLSVPEFESQMLFIQAG